MVNKNSPNEKFFNRQKLKDALIMNVNAKFLPNAVINSTHVDIVIMRTTLSVKQLMRLIDMLWIK